MPGAEIYYAVLLAILGIAVAITAAATLHSVYRKDHSDRIVLTKDNAKELFRLSPKDVEKLQSILARESRNPLPSAPEPAPADLPIDPQPD